MVDPFTDGVFERQAQCTENMLLEIEMALLDQIVRIGFMKHYGVDGCTIESYNGMNYLQGLVNIWSVRPPCIGHSATD